MNGTYVTQDRIEHLVANLSERDRAVLLDLARVRVLRGRDLTRMHFNDLAPSSRERTRRRVLARLVEQQLAATLSRTVGGATGGGSSDHIYALGIAGERALSLIGAQTTHTPLARSRSPRPPRTLFLGHSLAVSALYASLRTAERDASNGMRLAEFQIEPTSWHPDGTHGVLKPDAYALLHSPGLADSWWLEVDRATESIPTLRKKLLAYVDFARRGSTGPDDVMPRVLVTVPDGHRLATVSDLVASLPSPASQLIFTTLHDQAVCFMITALRVES